MQMQSRIKARQRQKSRTHTQRAPHNWSPMILGTHASIAGGLHLAFERCAEQGGECLQIFSRNQRQWKVPAIRNNEARQFRAASESSGIPLSNVMVHNSYLINLATGDREKLRSSRRAMLSEIRRCEQLCINLLNLHPGSHLGRGEEEGLTQVIESLDGLIAKTADSPVRLILETTAGQGTSLGHCFEHMRTILEGVEEPSRLGVCLDTAHCFAAGYNLSSSTGYTNVMKTFDQVVGLQHLVAFHVNDSKVGLGSHVDRHAAIGAGEMGEAGFKRLVRDRRFENILGFVELPESAVAGSLKRLRSYRSARQERKAGRLN